MAGITAGIIIGAVGATTGIVSAVVSGKQGQQSLDMQRNIGELDLRNKANLEKALQLANSNNMQIKIRTDTITNIQNAKNNALIQATILSRQASKDAEKRNLVIVGVGGAVVVVGALAVLKLS
jgi:hypothetical protein